MTGFVLDMFFKPEPKIPPKPELPPVPVHLLETKSMNERKRRPTYLPGRWIHKLCGLKRNIVLVNKTDHHVKFMIKKIPSCKCFMSTCKILLPSGAGIECQFENQEMSLMNISIMLCIYFQVKMYSSPWKWREK